ncbi:DUF3000 domain-containing protein [Catelliglobosispora koreensis]|uniref:DUF3000 domain-containing protein n=1 Tax=Catelliglobosispora koreensis TaxID=129052 RepID=UPI00036BB43F|nr:DUF3000 domain-containing protein [Catelliglobosispora koreensis]
MALTTVLPETFTRAVSVLQEFTPRSEIALEEVPAPRKLAPFSFALGATVLRNGEEVTTGRLILLHDPAGHEAWEGQTRLVCYVEAEVEADLANDPLLPQVTWGWLIDALDAHTDGYRAVGGTVTQTTSSRFGGLQGPTTTDLELRASWTPHVVPPEGHLEAWCALLASTAGLPPVGVAALPLRRS